ncbi:hypothetical protein GH714_000330 [Hevea brasiliensis]|uniref:ABC transporter family G domain-containing protein n=1 Tax=Hevea brasiliensis TaxID=3981 RepID=A0A6A6N5S9_HEVBR|nr:hypothetical protein GH714_000330 [Hevea brasiliensis]
MEGAEICIPGGSLRRRDSSIWSSNAMESFSKSSREEDDEEALKWAAIERLTIYDRLKKGILATSKGANEIDVHTLGFHERKALVDRVGIEFPTIEVRFENLTVETEAHNDSASGASKFREDHSFVGFGWKLDPKLKLSGRVTYNGHGMNDFLPQRTAAYISQHDTRIGEMIVRETLAFSARCEGVGQRYGVLATLMGSSGAAKITLMDVLAGGKTGGKAGGNPFYNLQFIMDEPTSGLDARAAAIVMRAVRNTVDTGRTVVCTIHQPSIDIFEAFDEVRNVGTYNSLCLFVNSSASSFLYMKIIEGVPNIKDGYNPATWMLEVATSAQETVLGVDSAAVYRNSELYRKNKALIEELSTPAPGSKDLYFPTQYSQSFFIQCMACLWNNIGHTGAIHRIML